MELGYSQIRGVDYTDKFAPVAHDVSFRIALARMMVEELDSLVMDVETAYLYGEIDEEIFIKSPVGMEEIDPGSSPEDCYQLLKGIYGLCQANRQFWKKFVNISKQEPFGFQVTPGDPCMLFKENVLGVCIIIMYVDDMLIIGKKEQIQEFATKIQKEFSVKLQHNLTDYLGCEFHMNKNKRMAWTTIYHHKSRTKIWRESNESKIVSNTWIPKIHSKKAREPRGQSEFRGR